MELKFKEGAKDALPIFLGYFAVSITFGVASVSYGFPSWVPVITSVTNYTGAGQALGIQLLSVTSTSLIELLLAMIIINIRYSLMSISLSQMLSPKVTLAQRFILAFGITDENYAVAATKNREITFKYMLGIELVAYAGWVAGTIVGAFVGSVLPAVVMTSFGIALPAMFVAIIIPPCSKNYRYLVVVVISVAIACLFYYVPVLSSLSKGWVYIICGLVSATAGALLFPVKDKEAV